MKEKLIKKKKSRSMLFWIKTALILLSVSLIWLWWSNVSIKNTSYTVYSKDLPHEFSGFRIVQVSDLHNEERGTDNKGILGLIEKQKPDIIAITGDIIDGDEIDNVIPFLEGAVRIAPCYYVTGNHEGYASDETYKELEEIMLELGVEVLHNRSVIVERNGQRICIGGIDDVRFTSARQGFVTEKLPDIDALFTENDTYNVLLAHRPDYFDTYTQSKAHLVLCGHAHGGQVIVPFVGGLYAPTQGFLPKYTKGVFEENGTTMIISTGAGNGTFLPRVNNRPEIVTLTLEPQK